MHGSSQQGWGSMCSHGGPQMHSPEGKSHGTRLISDPRTTRLVTAQHAGATDQPVASMWVCGKQSEARPTALGWERQWKDTDRRASSQRYGPWRGSLSTLLPAPSSLPPQAGLSDPSSALLDPVLWPAGGVGNRAREFRMAELHHHHRGPAGSPPPPPPQPRHGHLLQN